MAEPSIEELINLWGKQEELHPDLKSHVYSMNSGWKIIHHPLLIYPLYTPERNAFCNESYAAAVRRVESARANENWQQYVFMHERPYRVSVFHQLLDERPDIDRKSLLPVLASIWIDSENINETKDCWDEIWDEFGMFGPADVSEDEADRLAFANLPDTVTVYRGFNAYSEGQYESYSWTTSYDTAVLFANINAAEDGLPTILTGTVDKTDIRAVFLGRDENEIVVRSGSVTVMSEKPI